MFEEDFPICNVCGKTLISDANLLRIARYCKLCGMVTEDVKKFCCERCERIFKRFIRRRKDDEAKKWIKQN